MVRILFQKQALNAMLVLLVLVILFHILVLMEIIPYDIVWAGKINNVRDMRMFEGVSILINIFLASVLLLKRKSLEKNISTRILNGIIWFFVIVFVLNTIGNLFSKTMFELYVFTSLTFISAFLCWQILMGKPDDNKPAGNIE